VVQWVAHSLLDPQVVMQASSNCKHGYFSQDSASALGKLISLSTGHDSGRCLLQPNSSLSVVVLRG